MLTIVNYFSAGMQRLSNNVQAYPYLIKGVLLGRLRVCLTPMKAPTCYVAAEIRGPVSNSGRRTADGGCPHMARHLTVFRSTSNLICLL